MVLCILSLSSLPWEFFSLSFSSSAPLSPPAALDYNTEKDIEKTIECSSSCHFEETKSREVRCQHPCPMAWLDSRIPLTRTTGLPMGCTDRQVWGQCSQSCPQLLFLTPKQSGGAPHPALSLPSFRTHHLVSFIPEANIYWGGGPLKATKEVL